MEQMQEICISKIMCLKIVSVGYEYMVSINYEFKHYLIQVGVNQIHC